MESSPRQRARNPVGVIVLLALASVVAQAGERSLASKGRVVDEPSDWVTRDLDRMASGAESNVTVARLRPGISVEHRFSIDGRATDGLLAGPNLYLVRSTDTTDALLVANLEAEPRLRDAGLEAPASTLRLAHMDDYLVVAESGAGVHILRLPHRHAGHHGHPANDPGLQPEGFLSVEEPLLAVATSLRTIWVATERQVIEIDARVPSLPALVRRVPAPGHARALAVTGRSTLRLLEHKGLWTIEAGDSGQTPAPRLEPGVRGSSLLALGRSIFVASGSGGVERYQDTTRGAATFIVQVGDAFFSPAGAINVNAGDTVEWRKPATVFTHNVRSCTAGQTGCGGATATQAFASGAVTTAPFVFSFTFTVPGNNLYVCQSHAFSMVGDVVVTGGGPAPPPAVPSGGAFAPVRVSKLSPTGTDLQISFDTGCPDAVNHDLIHGTSATLPGAPGQPYGLIGASCATGGSPFAWADTPVPAPGTFVWWVLVADDGASIEGSWGKDWLGNERDGSGLNGASGACGNTDKDLANTCGQ